ncbi:hypothetical protein RJ639_002102, partial [Escallonia herrerae]
MKRLAFFCSFYPMGLGIDWLKKCFNTLVRRLSGIFTSVEYCIGHQDKFNYLHFSSRNIVHSGCGRRDGQYCMMCHTMTLMIKSISFLHRWLSTIILEKKGSSDNAFSIAEQERYSLTDANGGYDNNEGGTPFT